MERRVTHLSGLSHLPEVPHLLCKQSLRLLALPYPINHCGTLLFEESSFRQFAA